MAQSKGKGRKIKFEDLDPKQQQRAIALHFAAKCKYEDGYQPEIKSPEEAQKDPDYEDE